jgi:hypothetical protein
MRLRELLGLLVVAVTAAGPAAGAEPPCGYRASDWGGNVPGGTTTTVEPTTMSVSLRYDVNLGDPGPGVSLRSAVFTTTAPADGVLEFDWSYTGFHSFFISFGGCTITSDLAGGAVVQDLVPFQDVLAPFAFSGSTSIMVEAGRTVTVTLSGRNNDSNSRLMGNFTLSNMALHTNFASATDVYRTVLWTSTGIAGGTTNISAGGTPMGMTGVFSYNVNLGNPGGGVSYRTTEFSAIASGCGPVSFDWNWSGYHAFFAAQRDLHAFADGPHGRMIVDLANGGSDFFNVSGAATVNATLGYKFGLLVGGGNFDSDSRVLGTITLSNFSGPRAFEGPYQGQFWAAAPMAGGTASIIPSCGPSSTMRLSYNVNLGNPGSGVSPRSAEMSVVADQTGVASMDWNYSGFHAFFQAAARLDAFADTAAGRITTTVFVGGGGNFSARGCVRLNVESGRRCGFVVTGSNFDSNSTLLGNVTLSNFCIGPTAPCTADFNRSGAVSVQDIFDFLAAYFGSDRRADVNCSNGNSVQDLFDFLAAYFAGCP